MRQPNAKERAEAALRQQYARQRMLFDPKLGPWRLRNDIRVLLGRARG